MFDIQAHNLGLEKISKRMKLCMSFLKDLMEIFLNVNTTFKPTSSKLSFDFEKKTFCKISKILIKIKKTRFMEKQLLSFQF